MEAKMQYLLDRSHPFDHQKARLLDELTYAIKNNTAESKQANEAWRQLKQDHYFWYNADQVLSLCELTQSKVYMLVLLEDAIKQKWLALQVQQRNELKNYIVDLILKYAAVQNLEKPLQNILAKCNCILIQIVKYEWNTSWTSFINDICAASVNNMNICENNLSILKMLSEEIFDHSKSQLTQQQIAELKSRMNQDFTTVFELCKLVLENAHQAKPALVRACLETLGAFLTWVPMYYVIHTDMVDQLVLMFHSDYLRNHALACLVEIAALPLDPNDHHQTTKYLFMLQRVTEQLNMLIPLSSEDQHVQGILHSVRKKNRNIFEVLARGIANFYSEFFRNQHHWLGRAVRGSEEAVGVCHYGLRYLLMMMKIDEDQVFKITIDFFHFYIGAYLNQSQGESVSQSMRGESQFGTVAFGVKGATLQQAYQQIFREMAKPQEVLIVIDEEGVPVREEMENTENTSLYEIQRELGQYLVRYNWPEMKKFILQQIEKQQQPQHFHYDTLNSLSWIVGSLCGSIQEREERSFFISTLRTLLQLCEHKKGKENKAVIASCIMYVVGQYPSFLRNNWTFLKTVVRKLFEFMREEYPGIMEMACNAFLKIARSTADQFAGVQLNESEPFLLEIIRKTPDITRRLTHQSFQHSFYQSLGHLISAEPDADAQLQLMKEALGNCLYEYFSIIDMAKTDQHVLKDDHVSKKLGVFFRLNEMLASGAGRGYAMLLNLLSQTMNKVYLYYSMEVTQAVAQQGKNVLNFMTVKTMRNVRREIIKVYTRALEHAHPLDLHHAHYMLSTFIFPLGELLSDFQHCPPETKDQEFVALFTVVLQKLSGVLSSEFLGKVVDMIFTSSLPLITSDFNSFPEIRANFFAFLKALIRFNFNSLFSLPQDFFNTVLDCVIWSLRHELSTYADLGLSLLQEILTNVNKNADTLDSFYARFHMRILTEILDVMTDGFHKSGLKAQINIFFILVHVTTQNMAIIPIAPDKSTHISNSDYLFNFLVERLSLTFTNVSKGATYEKVANWFKVIDEKLFEGEIEDYLILINRYSADGLNEK